MNGVLPTIGADLRGKAALVTGSSRGIGAAVARSFGAAGMRVAVHYRGAHHEAEQVKAAIEAAGSKAMVLQGDIAQPGVVERLIQQVKAAIEAAGSKAMVLQGDIAQPGVVERLIQETVAAFGRLDVLVNNAGDLLERRPVADIPDELFEQHIAVNIRPTFAACRAAVHQFRAQGSGGVIINLSSIAARTGGGGGSSLYAGSKAFIATFSRALAKEVAADGIRVNCVSPGVLATPMQDRTTPPEMLEAIRTQVPMRRIGTAEECAGAFLWLCSEQMSGYVTGQVLEVNGGLLMP